MTTKVKPVLLCVLDGWGLRKEREANAILQAATPNVDFFDERFPHTKLETSGLAVGLPEGQMGNSEVGHTNLGAGRIVYQDLVRINRAIEDGSFYRDPVICAAIRKAKENGRALHLMGLVSPGGVHSLQAHLEATIRMAEREGVARIFVHAFLDGRDTPPKSALGYVEELVRFLDREAPHTKVATVIGRYFAMDRDQRWDRVMVAYEAMVRGVGHGVAGPVEGVKEAYARGETDEFVSPSVCKDASGVPVGLIRDGDSVFFFNFRSDRAREITQLLAFDRAPEGVDRGARPQLSFFATMTEYKADFGLPVAFPPDQPAEILPQLVSEKGLRQLRCAETEKYAHVTFFFNGGREVVFPGEERILVPSPREVKTYDEKPEMSAREVTDKLVAAVESKQYGLIVCNFANPDMVGHTGLMEPTKKAIEVVDECLGRLYRSCAKVGMAMMVTADHGNAEQMVDPVTGEPHTAHTLLPVPFWLLDSDFRGAKLGDGILADVAPTVLQVMGLAKPAEMKGRGLVRG
ncbi:2,3-bisphosphoglycerate-independent phosphoglycerate mutase [Vulgatibacter incomptus]|uniref:2,3-bisphosphoglycerate-independent phosphoglycerate mutase n=1 Tax=Vulgatibacter incomptus TaxID=1391653 RepID=A0A0K1PFI6_9BACT|nr:2,3-bisphosphoglycerate-independent phosphoglycerate mutase [Vulgatibacter incomptus]AKU92275.1 2,3-bisphosphoglycerate-independent phosphoglycerate mutase [Vulgatibacter incomptus]